MDTTWKSTVRPESTTTTSSSLSIICKPRVVGSRPGQTPNKEENKSTQEPLPGESLGSNSLGSTGSLDGVMMIPHNDLS